MYISQRITEHNVANLQQYNDELFFDISFDKLYYVATSYEMQSFAVKLLGVKKEDVSYYHLVEKAAFTELLESLLDNKWNVAITFIDKDNLLLGVEVKRKEV